MLLARSEDDWIIKFTRGKNNEFVWPSSEDLDTVPECDIVKIIPDPVVDRRGGKMRFKNIKFDGFNI